MSECLDLSYCRSEALTWIRRANCFINSAVFICEIAYLQFDGLLLHTDEISSFINKIFIWNQKELNSNIMQSRGFEILRDLAVRRPSSYWIKPLMILRLLMDALKEVAWHLSPKFFHCAPASNRNLIPEKWSCTIQEMIAYVVMKALKHISQNVTNHHWSDTEMDTTEPSSSTSFKRLLCRMCGFYSD